MYCERWRLGLWRIVRIKSYIFIFLRYEYKYKIYIMERIKVTSSNVFSIGYLLGILEVEFKDKSIYQYINVPESLYVRLLNASSKGRFLKEHIKNRYRFIKIK